MARHIVHTHKGGWEAALTHPDAVIVDYDMQALRQGLSRYPIRGRRMFAFIAFMLRSADLRQDRPAINQAVFGRIDMPHNAMSRLVTDAKPIMLWLGMTIESHYDSGYRLHSDPKETLTCETLARTPQPPTHVRSHRDGPRMTRHEPLPSRDALEKAGLRRQRPRKRLQPLS